MADIKHSSNHWWVNSFQVTITCLVKGYLAYSLRVPGVQKKKHEENLVWDVR